MEQSPITPMMPPSRTSRPEPDDLLGRILALEDRLERLSALEDRIGTAPSPLMRQAGSGVWLAVHELGVKFDALAEKQTAQGKALEQSIDGLTKVIASREDASRAEEQRRAMTRAPFSRAIWIVLGAALSSLVTGVVGAAVYWLATLHH